MRGEGMEYTKLKNINRYISESVNPMKTPYTIYEMYSVPIYETGHPEFLRGDEIGSNKVSVQKDDILLCKINPRINRVWVVADESDYPSIASSEWIVIRTPEYNPSFLAWYFKSPKFKQLMVSEVTGIGGSLTRAQPKAVAEYPVPILPMEEQNEIAIILDKAANIILSRKQQLSALDDLIKARFVEMFGTPFDTSNWVIKELKDVSESMVDGSNVNPSYYETTGEVLFLRIQNVWRNELRLDDSVYITSEINRAYYYDTSLKKGDLLITKIGRYYTKDSSLGRVSVYLGEDDCANYSNNIMRVRLKDSVNSEFVNALLNLDEYQSFIKRTSKGGTDKRALSKSLIGSYPIIIPPMNLQYKFIDFVKQVDKSKSVIQKSLDETQLLFDSLMQKYFG